MHEVQLFFDFLSPYSWLALTQVERFARHHGVKWDLRPVVYGKLLDATGLVGPAEVPVKRRHTFQDVGRSAQLLGLKLVGPPAHPFRSLEALRTTTLFREDPRGLSLAVHLIRACWEEGRDLTSVEVLAELAAQKGFDVAALPERISAPEAKDALKADTQLALQLGVFGVPSFVFEGEVFWGHDRLTHLAARLRGELAPISAADQRKFDQLPRGADRPSR